MAQQCLVERRKLAWLFLQKCGQLQKLLRNRIDCLCLAVKQQCLEVQKKVIQNNSYFVYLAFLVRVHHFGLAFVCQLESSDAVRLDALQVSEGKVSDFLNALI